MTRRTRPSGLFSQVVQPASAASVARSIAKPAEQPGAEPTWMVEARDRALAPYRGRAPNPISDEDVILMQLEREEPEE